VRRVDPQGRGERVAHAEAHSEFVCPDDVHDHTSLSAALLLCFAKCSTVDGPDRPVNGLDGCGPGDGRYAHGMHVLGSFVALLALAAPLAAAPSTVRERGRADVPQEPAAPRRLGVFLWHDSPNDLTTLAGIRAAMEQSGLPHAFVEHHADSDPERARTALRELRAARCDIVFALGTQAALLAKDAIVDVPVVFAAVSDPVASGIVPDWSGSGNNLCGCSNWIAPANVLDVFLRAAPNCRRLGVLRSKTSGVVSTAEIATMRAHLAPREPPTPTLHEAIAASPEQLPAAVAELLAANVDAIWIPIDITVYQRIDVVRQALGERRLPLLTTAAAGVRNGAHVGAAIDYSMHGRRAAAMAIDVLANGRATATLPIDRMHGTLVYVNLGTARQDHVDLPLSLLALADELLDDRNLPEKVRGEQRR